MKIASMKVMRGPNLWSVSQVFLIETLLDISEEATSDSFASQKIMKFLREKCKDAELSVPSLNRMSGGINANTLSPAEIVLEIAVALQQTAGIDTIFTASKQLDNPSEWKIVFSYETEEAGLYAANAAVEIYHALNEGREPDVEKHAQKLLIINSSGKPGPSTASIINEARSRDIPVLPLQNGLFQLGYGKHRKIIDTTITSSTSNIAVEIVSDKNLTKSMLREAGIPVPGGRVLKDVEELEEALADIGFPIAIKPADSNQGKGVQTNIGNRDEAVAAFGFARQFSGEVIVERFISGEDYRILLIDYTFVAAAKRVPACVTGDGIHSIAERIKMLNSHPNRGTGHDNVLTRIELDSITIDFLQKQGLTPESILPEGRHAYLRPTANLSTGGTAHDVTDDIHPDNISVFERAARVLGLDICGIDVVANDLSKPIQNYEAAVIEVNAAPGFRMHLSPSSGKPRNVAKPVLDMLFPKNNSRIPIIAITGTNGKTTTTRLTASIVNNAGFNTGYTTTDGVYLGNKLILKGDCSGPSSAHIILKDPLIEFAILECARGGMLRSGLGFDKCSAGIVLNVAEDHLGLQSINTLEQLAEVKSIIAKSVMDSGTAVLNADDDLVYNMRNGLTCNIALFSLDPENRRIKEHTDSGGLAAVLKNDYITIIDNGEEINIERVEDIACTFGGAALFNIVNAMAATLATYSQGIAVDVIRRSLREFHCNADTTPGRLNVFEGNGFKVIIDYAHNIHGLKAVGSFIERLKNRKKIGIIAGVGDRRDEDIQGLGREAAKIFDEIIIRNDKDLRGRDEQQLLNLLKKGIAEVDINKVKGFYTTEREALIAGLGRLSEGDLLVHFVEDTWESIQLIKEKVKTAAVPDSTAAA